MPVTEVMITDLTEEKAEGMPGGMHGWNVLRGKQLEAEPETHEALTKRPAAETLLAFFIAMRRKVI